VPVIVGAETQQTVPARDDGTGSSCSRTFRSAQQATVSVGSTDPRALFPRGGGRSCRVPRVPARPVTLSAITFVVETDRRMHRRDSRVFSTDGVSWGDSQVPEVLVRRHFSRQRDGGR